MVSDGGEPLTGMVNVIFRWPYGVGFEGTYRLSDVDLILDQEGRE